MSQSSGKADEYLDDMAFLLSQSSTDTDSNSMSSILSSIGTFSLADAKAATGVEARSTNELANKVVAKLTKKDKSMEEKHKKAMEKCKGKNSKKAQSTKNKLKKKKNMIAKAKKKTKA